MKRGTEFHEHAYKFFDKIKPDKKYTYHSFRKLLPKGKHFDNFAEIEWERYNTAKYFMPVLREKWLISRSLGLKGTVDRVDKLDNEEYCVVEYKTGKIHNLSMYRRELCIYAMMLNENKVLDGPVTHLKCLWVDQKKYLFEKIKPATRRATERAIKKVREGIAKKEFPKKPGILCAWCPFINVCLSLDEQSVIEALSKEGLI